MKLASGIVWMLFLCGCQIVVLGDSNSCLWPTGCLTANTLWPQYLLQRPDAPRWVVANRALPRMLAGAYPGDGALGNGEPANGAWHLDRIIREDLADACVPVVGRWFVRKKLVIALGTNDVAHAGVSGMDAGLAVTALYDRAVRVPCVDVYVATIPLRRDVPTDKISAANMVILTHVPPDRIIPFAGELPSDLFGAAHMTDEAQRRRADIAFRVLFPG